MLGKAVDLGFKFCVACGGQYLGNLLYDGEAKYYPQVVK